ncbi:hypothetical protein, partial [Enterococcus faecalis]|uniref:hypothetical protein n=1 Tax=Enterococcus faecalis TaxID=1351 RepID=UPI001C8DC841
ASSAPTVLFPTPPGPIRNSVFIFTPRVRVKALCQQNTPNNAAIAAVFVHSHLPSQSFPSNVCVIPFTFKSLH